MASAVSVLDGSRAGERPDVDRPQPGQECARAPTAGARASSESPQTNSSQSSGCAELAEQRAPGSS